MNLWEKKSQLSRSSYRERLLPLVACLLFVSGCEPPERGFRFLGGYEAKSSGFRIDVLSQGLVAPGHDIAEIAYALIQFCPLSTSNGQPFRVSMTATPDEWIRLESEEPSVSSVAWNWKSSEKILNDLLLAEGYQNIVPAEIADISRAMENSLAGPKGFILKGQVKSAVVLRDDIQYGYKFEKDTQPNEWIKREELASCDH